MHTLRTLTCLAVAITAAAIPFDQAVAQEAINSPAATQPSTGRWVVRGQFRHLDARESPRTGDERIRRTTQNLSIAYGLRSNLSLTAEVPFQQQRLRDGETGNVKRDYGIGDVTAQVKWRIHQHDFGPIDTSRFSLIGGVQLPTFMRPFSTESVNPMLGGVYTHVQGLHGFNASAIFKLNTGTGTRNNIGGGDGKADALFYDASYLYRISPATYSPETSGGALYGVLELNGLYETNGDNELFLSPGIMYEARSWTVEASVQIPVWQDVDRRPETRLVGVVGVRLLF